MSPTAVQRVENGAIAVLILTATILLKPAWWWVIIAAFLIFDLSALGYLRSPAAGAFWYNAVHNYTLPVLLGAVSILALLTHAHALHVWTLLTALAWAFHVAVDRALGYGLKFADAFTHTHLGTIGRDRIPGRDSASTR